MLRVHAAVSGSHARHCVARHLPARKRAGLTAAFFAAATAACGVVVRVGLRAIHGRLREGHAGLRTVHGRTSVGHTGLWAIHGCAGRGHAGLRTIHGRTREGHSGLWAEHGHAGEGHTGLRAIHGRAGEGHAGAWLFAAGAGMRVGVSSSHDAFRFAALGMRARIACRSALTDHRSHALSIRIGNRRFRLHFCLRCSVLVLVGVLLASRLRLGCGILILFSVLFTSLFRLRCGILILVGVLLASLFHLRRGVLVLVSVLFTNLSLHSDFCRILFSRSVRDILRFIRRRASLMIRIFAHRLHSFRVKGYAEYASHGRSELSDTGFILADQKFLKISVGDSCRVVFQH